VRDAPHIFALRFFSKRSRDKHKTLSLYITIVTDYWYGSLAIRGDDHILRNEYSYSSNIYFTIRWSVRL